MFNTKNLSPNKLSLFTAICLSIPVSIAFYFIDNNIYGALVALAVDFIGSYLLIRFVLESFITTVK